MSKQFIPWTGCQPELSSYMTLRDYFAASLLQGNLAEFNHTNDPSRVAAKVYRYADAMIAERDREEKP